MTPRRPRRVKERRKSLQKVSASEWPMARPTQDVRLARKQGGKQRADAAAERLEEFERLYNAKLALDAPVRYWQRKRVKHRWLAVAFFSAFVAYLVAAGLGLSILLRDTGLVDKAFWKDAGLALIGLALAAIGIVVGLARVLLRLAMSQLHLGNDADERVTMVNTYLALRQGEHADEQHMQIVLERLFAPATDGIVKDDLGPLTAAEAAKSAFART